VTAHREHPEAGAELFAAAEHLERIEPGLGHQGTKRFHYRVVYVVHNGELVILAYAHEKQRPGYWKHRFSDILDG
jgi:hypothetical protein